MEKKWVIFFVITNLILFLMNEFVFLGTSVGIVAIGITCGRVLQQAIEEKWVIFFVITNLMFLMN